MDSSQHRARRPAGRGASPTGAALRPRLTKTVEAPWRDAPTPRRGHDIGKIAIPDAILRKQGPLDDAEWEEMRRHPDLGARMLGGPGLQDVRGWLIAHHERPDGRGYPRGLPSDQIPLDAAILAVADAYEAMTADRPYRKSLGEPAARAELRRHAGTQFDERVVDAFLTWLAGSGEQLAA